MKENEHSALTEQTADNSLENKTRKEKRRQQKKAAYRALSPKRKILFWLIRGVIALAVIAVLACVIYWLSGVAIEAYYQQKYENSLIAEVSDEELYAEAPKDIEGEARVAAIDSYDPNDTWVIYMYVCGSTLESLGRNELSDTAQYYVEQKSREFIEYDEENNATLFMNFIDEMQEHNVQLPSYLFLPDYGSYMYDDEADGSGNSYREGYATGNLRDILSVKLPENVSIVIQTGGSASWSYSQINPNASQRFLYNSDGLTLLSTNYPKNMGDCETLTDFLKYCKDEHPADHRMLLFWNHGDGAFGCCNDELFNHDGLTLDEMNTALDDVYRKNTSNPPFELIGFDACLMASTEVAESLYGYSRYLAASEETEPGSGWDYCAWLGALAENPGMNGAQLGKEITDSFVDSCAKKSINLRWAGGDVVATFSVVDVTKAHSVYQAYSDVAAAVLQDTAENPQSLAIIGRASGESIRFSGSHYKYNNTVDLGVFMQNFSQYYPEETEKVLKAIDNSVLYHRETSYAKGSMGLSVYFPTNVDTFYGLNKYLIYVNEICTDPDVKTLYYYKIAGCLNDELQNYVDKKGYGTFKSFDAKALNELSFEQLTFNDDNSIEIPLSDDAACMIQDMSVYIAHNDVNSDMILFLGQDNCLYTDENNNIVTYFDGNWLCMDGHFLNTEIIDFTDEYIRYRSPITYNGSENAYLILVNDLESGEISVLGVQTSDNEADTMCRCIEPLENGDEITPNYRMQDLTTEKIRFYDGDTFKYHYNSTVKNTLLDDGEYYLIVSVVDTRGDEYYAAPVTFRMANGKITDMAVADNVNVINSAY